MDENKDKMVDDVLEKRLTREDRRGRRKSRKKDTDQTLYGEDLPPKKKKGFFGILIRLILLVLVAGLIWICVGMGREYFRKTTEGGRKIEVVIEQGEGLGEISQELKDKKVVSYRLPFFAKAYFSGKKGDIRYGTFELTDTMSLDDIIKTLTTQGARKDQVTLTIPEGYSIERMGLLLEEKGIMTNKEFLDAVASYEGDFAFKEDLPDSRDVFYVLQGYLFPDTYYLDVDVSPEELVGKMLENFEEHFGQDKLDKAKELGMTVPEVVTRASIVQQETVQPTEYPIVADVLTNRMEINMNLQLDSTVVYVITKGLYNKEKVYYSDLKVDTPYNTYTHKGLPPGPICCPGEEAIDGVLNPVDNDYLYFQTDSQSDDGSNLFFETYEEHSSAQATTGREETTEAAAPGADESTQVTESQEETTDR